jgi:hypothetical protein
MSFEYVAVDSDAVGCSLQTAQRSRSDIAFFTDTLRLLERSPELPSFARWLRR